MKRNYVVGVKSPSDWEHIHILLTQDGTLEDNIPVRSCCCVDEKLYSPTRSTYLLAEEEADLLKSHDKIAFVELDYTYHGKDVEFQDHFPKFETLGLGDTSRFQNPVKVYRSVPGEVPFPPSQALTSAELNRTNWGLLRSNSREDPWKEILGTNTLTFAEYGTTNVDHNWQVISFSGEYISPVIVASDPSYNGPAQASVRIRNVNTTTRTFEISIQETSDLDNIHVLERIHWIVMESGCYQLPDGTRFSAGTINTSILSGNGFTTVNFTESIGTDVHVISQVMTNNEVGWLTTRITNITSSSFQITMQEEELSNSGTHAIETIGWIAFNNSVTNDGNTRIESGTYTLSISNTESNFSFNPGFSTLPSVFAKIGSFNGIDPANVRITFLSNTGFAAFILEDITSDTETTHTPENLTFLALENQQGSLEGVKVTNPYYLFSNSPRARYLLDTPKYFSGQDGSGTDCIIVDDGVWLGHPEFVNDAGISQVRDIILDGPYYIDPDYFISTGQTTVFLGRLTCTEQAAISWWTNSSLRSPQFQSIGTIPGLSINNYSRALICGNYSQLPTRTAIYPSFSSHGTACASLMYGKNFGWAFNSNKWTITQELDGLPGLTIIQVLEVLALFHDNKPRSSDNKIIPSIISNSWGATNNVANQFSITGYYQFRNGPVTSFTNKTSAPQFLKNFEIDNNSRYQRYLNPASFSSFILPGEELLSKSGVYYIVAAGNENQKQVNPGDLDYNNWWSNVANPLESQKEYVNRRGYPAQLGYQFETNSYRSISVGSLSVVPTAVVDGLEYIDGYSNSGPAIDVISPGNSVLAANSTDSIGYPRWDDNNYYTWLNKSPIQDISFTGTSAACPVAAGLIASIISTNTHWTPNILKSYISNLVKNQTPAEFLIRGDIASVTDENSVTWTDRFALYSQEPKVLYNAAVPSLGFSIDLPQETAGIYRDSITFTVQVDTTLSPLASSYTFEWEIKQPDQLNFSSNFSGISTTSITGISSSPSLTLSSVPITLDGAQIRCKITPNGPYAVSYSSATTINLIAGTLVLNSEPPPYVSLFEGNTFSLSASASILDIQGEISYQWRKLEPIYVGASIPVYVGDFPTNIPGANSPTYTVQNATVADSNLQYDCVISNINCINSPLITSGTQVVVNTLYEIQITSQPIPSQNIYVGGSFQLSVVANVLGAVGSQGQIFYQWQKRSIENTWVDISGANSSTYSITGASFSSSGSYRCVLTNSIALNSPVISSIASINILELPIIAIISHPQSLLRIAGKTAIFGIIASTGTGNALSYQWQKSINQGQTWSNIQDANSLEYRIDNVQSTDIGQYRCIVIDNLAQNSPVESDPASLDVITLTVTDPLPQDIILNRSALFSVSASTTSGDPILYQWQKSTNDGVSWENIVSANSSTYIIPSTNEADLGLYRCRVVDVNDTSSPIFSQSARLTLIIIDISISQQPVSAGTYITGLVSISTDAILSSGESSLLQYQWQKLSGDNAWTDVLGATSKTYVIDQLSANDLGSYRCKISYELSYQSPVYTNVVEVFEEEIQLEIINVPRQITIFTNSQTQYNAFIEVYSNFPELITYQWQLFNLITQQWEDLEGQSNDILVLTDNFDGNNYLVRCIVSSIGISIESSEIFVIVDTSRSTLFNSNDCGNCLTESQLRELNNICEVSLLKDNSCSRESINTCGMDISEMISMYQFYNYQKGIYSGWGDIIFPWNSSENVPNLVFNSEDNKWRTAKYSSIVSYFLGERVLLIEDNGYRICLYEATQDILSISGHFDLLKWKKICQVEVAEPFGLPSPDELRQRFNNYKLEVFEKDWDSYSSSWNFNSLEQSTNFCLSQQGIPLNKCLSLLSSDKFNQAWVRRDNFYMRGDIVLVESGCGDLICVYSAIRDIPVTNYIFEKYGDKPFSTHIFLSEEDEINNVSTEVWSKNYCVSTGENKCLSYRRKNEVEEGYDIIEIGSKGNYVEVPKPYAMNISKDLYSVLNTPRREILTPQQILEIEGKEDVYRTDCTP